MSSTDPFSIDLIKPSARWQSLIENYLFVIDERLYGDFNELLLPDKDLMLMINLTPGTHHYQSLTDTSTREIQQNSYLFTHHRRGFSIKKQGKVKVFIIHFKPAAFFSLIKESLNILPKDTILPLENLVGNKANTLTERIMTLQDKGDIINCFENWLLENYSSLQGPDKLTETAWNIIIHSGGTKKVDHICKEVGMSYKTMERKFNLYIGYSPKELCNIIRFRKAFYQYSSFAFPDFMEIVHSNGYFDQMHFIKDFKFYTGRTPMNLHKIMRSEDHQYHKAYSTISKLDKQKS